MGSGGRGRGQGVDVGVRELLRCGNGFRVCWRMGVWVRGSLTTIRLFPRVDRSKFLFTLVPFWTDYACIMGFVIVVVWALVCVMLVVTKIYLPFPLLTFC